MNLLIKADALEPTENLTEYISLRQSFEKVENQLLRDDRESFRDVVPRNEWDRENNFYSFIEEQEGWL